ncbi:MAG: hypothetical protein P9L99_16955 [Candidatus Lernaella stagnicola]|nr:hypothetical protein [Candidatus Lernaella stagnicola]
MVNERSEKGQAVKLPPDMAQALAKMKPGVISKDGFLGDDDRPLPEIISDQHAACLRRGVTCEAIADAMRRVGRAGLAGFGAPISVEEKWEVTADENRGKLACPWPHPGMFQKTVYTVKSLRTGRAVRFTELSIHLVEKHCFFEGAGAVFYNDPEALIDVLELTRSDELPEVPNLTGVES